MSTVSNYSSRDRRPWKNHRTDSNSRIQPLTPDDVAGLLESVYQRLSQEHVDDRQFHSAMDQLILSLRNQKMNCSESRWKETVAGCRRHPLTHLLHEDPFTYRAFSKPRGYAGDAVMMDYIYGREELWSPPPATPRGQRIFDYTTVAPAPEGVLSRRGFIANRLDWLAEKTRLPHVLSLAAGHLREASLSAAVKRRQLGRFVALDSDPLSVEEVERAYGCFGIETVQASIRGLLTDSLSLGSFDYVYSLGLFDYLGEAAGTRLVKKMFEMLRPQGRVLVANFLPNIRDIGYMEIYMDWSLIYRTRTEMMQLTDEIPQADIKDITVFAEENQNILFLEITKS